MAVACPNDESIVVFIGRFLAPDMFLWDADAQANGLTLPVDGVAGRVVGAPAGTQPLMVGELLRALDVDDACGEQTVSDVLVEEHVDISIAMTGILRITDGHVQSLPTTVEKFSDGSQRTIGDDALSA